MYIDKPNPIEKIEARICELQKSHVALQEKLKNVQHHFERYTDDSALRIIDMLDMIAMTQLTRDLDSEANSNAQRIIKKIEKRITDLLRFWQVQEIVFPDGRIEPGKARVLDTRMVSGEMLPGTIIEVCRKGYQRGDKIIRPADVITVAS